MVTANIFKQNLKPIRPNRSYKRSRKSGRIKRKYQLLFSFLSPLYLTK